MGFCFANGKTLEGVLVEQAFEEAFKLLTKIIFKGYFRPQNIFFHIVKVFTWEWGLADYDFV